MEEKGISSSAPFFVFEFLSLCFCRCDTSRTCLVNNLLLMRLQNALENEFFPLQKAINPRGAAGIFLTQGLQCGQVFWWLELHSE